ncbi:MAG TPA: hypothetical protein PLC97_08805 [Myxococcota bacterium]|nr:hypothetical protein [Myxococcota bacterium]
MGVQTNEVVTVFSFSGQLSKLKNYNEMASKALKQAGALSAALLGGVTAAAVWANKMLDGVTASHNFARAQGLTVEQLQALQWAAESTGGSAEALNMSINQLGQRMGKYAQLGTGEVATAFQAMGVVVKDATGKLRPTVDVLSDIAEASKGMDAQSRANLAQQLGIDKTVLGLLKEGAGGIAALTAEATSWGLVSSEQAARANEFTKSLTALKFQAKTVAQRLAIEMLPAMNDLRQTLQDLLKDNKQWLDKGLGKIGEAAKQAVAFLKRMAPILAVIGVALQVAFAPVSLMTIGIIAAILAIDDLIVAFKGGESVIAKFFDSFGVDIRPALHDFATWVQDMSSGFLAIGKQVLPGLVTSLKEAFAAIIPAGKAVFAALGPIFASLVPILGETIKNVKALFKTIEHLFGFIGSFLQGDMNGMLYNLGGVMVWLGALFGGVIRGIAALAKGVIKGIGGIIRSMLPEALSGAIEDMTAFFVGFLDLVTSLLTGDFSRAWDMVKDIAQAAVDMIADMFRGLWAGIKAMFSGLGHLIMDAARAVLPDWAVNLLGTEAAEPDKSDLSQPARGIPTEAVYPDKSDLSQPARGIPTAAALAGIPVEAVMPSLPIFESAPSQVSRSTTVNQDVTIQIASTEPQQAGKAVQRGLEAQLEQAQRMAGRGGR